MNNISIGQYIPKDSWIHRLDPRFKMLSVIILIVATFLIKIPGSFDQNGWIRIGLLMGVTIFSVILIVSANIPILKALSGLKSIMFLITFMTIIQFFTFKEGTEIFGPQDMNISFASIILMLGVVLLYFVTKKYLPFKVLYFLVAVFFVFFVQAIPSVFPSLAGVFDFAKITNYSLKISDQALIRSGFLFLRMVNVILITSLLTFTTMPMDLNYGLEFLLSPLKIFRFPVAQTSMMFALALRNIPTLLDETEKIMKAQASRGADLKEGNIKDKVIRIVSMLIPVFIISINRATDLSNAMDVRGYEINGKRTRIDQFEIKATDIISLVSIVLLLGAFISLRIIF